jgi:hypothetical protein
MLRHRVHREPRFLLAVRFALDFCRIFRFRISGRSFRHISTFFTRYLGKETMAYYGTGFLKRNVARRDEPISMFDEQPGFTGFAAESPSSHQDPRAVQLFAVKGVPCDPPR